MHDLSPSATHAITVTRASLEAHFTRASDNAVAGCGGSDVLYNDRYSSAVDRIVGVLPDSWRAEAFQIANDCGDYAMPEERAAQLSAAREAGNCSLTGIDPDCCPCGRHP